MFVIVCFVLSASVVDTSLIDGSIIAKTSNLTGYDLWFPNGSFRYVKTLQADYICNDWWYDIPVKERANSFNPKGFGLVVLVALVMTFVFTTSFPMLVLNSKQNGYIIRTIKKFWTIILAFTTNEDIDEDTTQSITATEKRLNKMEVFAIAWMIIGVVIMFVVSLVLANAVMTINGWPSAIKVEENGYCYYVDSSNLIYSEAVAQAAKLLQDEHPEEAELVPGTALVSIENDGSRTFFSSCVDSFYEPVVGSGIIWKLMTPYRKVCESIPMKKFEKYHTTLWYGCKIGKGCHYDWERKDDPEYNTRFASCCSGDSGQKGNSKEQCNVESNARFTACAFSSPKFRMRSNEFIIKDLPGWEKCEYIDNHQGFKLYRQEGDKEEDVTSQYLLHATESNAEHTIYPFGWLTANKGTEIIVLTQSNIPMDGLGGPMYWGNMSNEEWMKAHFNLGSIEYGWEDSEQSLPGFYPLSVVPPFKEECRMTFTTSPEIKNLAEFKTYCKDVWARINEYGNVMIATSSEEMCVVNIAGNVLGETINASVTIDDHTPAMFRMIKPMYWQCDTQNTKDNNTSIAGPCGISKKWNEFTPEYYETNIVITHETNYDGFKAEPREDSKPSMWSKVKEVLIIIAIVFACIVVVVAIFIIVMKITSRTECCKAKCPKCADFGMRLCNRRYIPSNDITINLNNKEQDE